MQAPPGETERRLGLQPGDLDHLQEVPVWPENWLAVEVFGALQTQWTLAPSGALTGLRYESVPIVCHALRVPSRRRRRLFRNLQIMESAVLAALREEHDSERPC